MDENSPRAFIVLAKPRSQTGESDVEAEFDHVPVPHDVVLALHAGLAQRSDGGHRSGRHQVGVADDLGLDEAPLEVGVDDAGGFGGGGGRIIKKSTGLLGPGGQEGLQSEGVEPDVDQLDQAGLVLPVAGEELGRLLDGQAGHLGLDGGANHDGPGRGHELLQRRRPRGVAQRVLVDVEHVDERLGRQEVQLAQGLEGSRVELAGGGGGRDGDALVQQAPGQGHRGHDRAHRRVAARLAGQAVQPVVDGLDVGQDQLGVDRLDVARRVDPPFYVDDVVVGEGPHHLADGVGLADGGQELVAQPLPARRAPHQPGDVHEGDRRRHHPLAVVEGGQPVQTLVGDVDHPHVGVDGGERVVGRQGLVAGEGVEQRRLAHVGQADDPDRKSHEEPAYPGCRPRPIYDVPVATTASNESLTSPEPRRGRDSAPSPSYSITVRLHAVPSQALVGVVATAVSAVGGLVTAIDVSDSRPDRVTIDVTCSAIDGTHADEIVRALGATEGVEVYRVSDRTFLLHLGGKIEVRSKVSLRTRDDLSMAYTPGVGRVALAIAANPADAVRLTVKGNSVAVVTDGSAVLGLGNLGPAAALPVMEGKAALFKRFAGIDAWPICLDTQDADEIVATVRAISPGFGGINLEDISAPRCFEIERRLRDELDIPVFHDDQHGTAIVVLAALTNALRCVNKRLEKVRIVQSGAGAAGTAIALLLMAAGAKDILVWDREGILSPDDASLNPSKRQLTELTNPGCVTGDLRLALQGADVFIGVSGPGVLDAGWIPEMAPLPVVFALANPDPEVDVDAAQPHSAVIATGRSDYPNQINNVLVFPGVFRGLLDARARDITTPMMLAAADALAHCVSDEQLNATYIVPSVFDPAVPKAVAAAVRESTTRTGS